MSYLSPEGEQYRPDATGSGSARLDTGSTPGPLGTPHKPQPPCPVCGDDVEWDDKNAPWCSATCEGISAADERDYRSTDRR